MSNRSKDQTAGFAATPNGIGPVFRQVCAALAILSVSGFVSPAGAQKIQAQPAKNLRPDLRITGHGVSYLRCTPGSSVYGFRVRVKNSGTGVAGPTTITAYRAGNSNWSGSAAVGALVPGQARWVTIMIPYFGANPSSMTSGPVNYFTAVADYPTNQVAESNEGNNSHRIVAQAPTGC